MAESTGKKTPSKNSKGVAKSPVKTASKVSVKASSEKEKSIALETKNAVNKFATISDVRVAISNLGEIHMEPYDVIAGYGVRPGIYELNGATAIPTGVNFTISSNQAYYCELLLFKRESNVPYAVLPFPDNYRIGNVWSMIVFDIDIEEFEYAYRFDGPYDPKKGLIFDKNKIILDPYAKAVTGQSQWGTYNDSIYKARVVKNNFDWGRLTRKHKAMEDLIIYEMHVRGFTKDKSSGTGDKAGTFAGIMEKLPYLKELGVNALELMPIFEFDETLDHRDFYGRELMDYWGYNTVSFFSPNTSYASAVEYNREGTELKEFIKLCHENDIDVLLDKELKNPEFRKAWEETELEYRIKEQMIELIDLLGMVSDTYPDFVVGVTQYCIRKPSRLEMVLQFLKENSNADSSDISEFIVNQPDFQEDNTAPVSQ